MNYLLCLLLMTKHMGMVFGHLGHFSSSQPCTDHAPMDIQEAGAAQQHETNRNVLSNFFTIASKSRTGLLSSSALSNFFQILYQF